MSDSEPLPMLKSWDQLLTFTIEITAKGRRGHTILHTFTLLSDHKWQWQQFVTRKQLKAIQRDQEARQEKRRRGLDDPGPSGWISGVPVPKDAPTKSLDNDYVVHLADGVDIHSGSLLLIFEALRRASPRPSSGGRRQVDLGVLKVVISEFGSRLAAAVDEPAQTWLGVLLPLCDDVAERCTTLEGSQ